MEVTGLYSNEDSLKEFKITADEIHDREEILIERRCSLPLASGSVRFVDGESRIGNSAYAGLAQTRGRVRKDDSPAACGDKSEANERPDLTGDVPGVGNQDANNAVSNPASRVCFILEKELNPDLITLTERSPDDQKVLSAVISNVTSTDCKKSLENCDLTPNHINAQSNRNQELSCAKESAIPREVSIESSEEDVLIEAILNEVRDSLLQFATFNSNYERSVSESRSPLNLKNLPDRRKIVDSSKKEPKLETIPLLAQPDCSTSRSAIGNNGGDDSEKIVSDDLSAPKIDFKIDLPHDNTEDDTDTNHIIENDNYCNGNSGEHEKSVDGCKEKSISQSDCSNENQDIKGAEYYTNPFGGVSCSNNVETFGDVQEPNRLENNVESLSSKTKKNEKNRKAKKDTKAAESIIDENVLDEVKTLLERVQTHTRRAECPYEPPEKDGESNRPKEKKKKPKKIKRRNSKSDSTSIGISSPDLPQSPAQRRILKRGITWKEKNKGTTSSIPDEEFRGCSPKEGSPFSQERNSTDDSLENYRLNSTDVCGNENMMLDSNYKNDKNEVFEDKLLKENDSPNALTVTFNENDESKVELCDNTAICALSSIGIDETEKKELNTDMMGINISKPLYNELKNYVHNIDTESDTQNVSKNMRQDLFDSSERLNSDSNFNINREFSVPNLSVEDEISPENKDNSSDHRDHYESSEVLVLNGHDAFHVDSDVFTFNTILSVINPQNPCFEFVSDNSSPVSTRSNSLDREVVHVNKSKSPQESALKEEDSSEGDVCVSPLFDDTQLSKLDGTEKILFKNKRPSSLPRNKDPSRIVSNAKSFEAKQNKSLDFIDTLSGEKEQFNRNYRDAAILYNEKCKCSEAETQINYIMQPQVPIVVSSLDSQISDKCHEQSDDSEGTDTWQPKNIREKIKQIIGARLQPGPSRDINNKSDRAQESSPLPRSSSHSASSKSSSDTMDYTSDYTRSFKTNMSNEGNKVATEFENPDCEEADEERDEGKYKLKLSFDAKHHNITYLTDSDEPTSFEGCKEDVVVLDSVKAITNSDDATSANCIVQRWENLQSKAAERQRQSTQLRQLQRQVKAIRLSMESVFNRCASFSHPHTLDDPSRIGQKVDEVRALLEEADNLRSDLSGLNVMVHRFTSEIGSSFTPLKEEMAELYRLWDETHRRVNGELSRLQSAEATWLLWEEQKAELSQALKQDSDTLKVIDAAIDNGKLTETVTASVHDVAKLLNERRFANSNKSKHQVPSVEISASGEKSGKNKAEADGKEDRLSDSGTSGYESCSSDDLSERERRLAYLKRLARDLEASLVPGSKAWNEINSTLSEAEKELHDLQDHCRSLILRTAETLDPSSKQLRFSSSSKRRNWAREAKSCCRSPRLERRAKSGNFRREWLWRVVRAALPFQAALLLLVCVTCLLEPNCCDSLNTLNLSFTPQLRFVHGSPPV